MAKNKSQYDSTLNLPKTLFEMRPRLPKNQPVIHNDTEDNHHYTPHTPPACPSSFSPTAPRMQTATSTWAPR